VLHRVHVFGIAEFGRNPINTMNYKIGIRSRVLSTSAWVCVESLAFP
jgi:hypothetical protein